MTTFAPDVPAQARSRPLTLPDRLPHRLADLAVACEASLSDVLLAVFQLLAGRWAGPRDVTVIGSVGGAALPLPAGLSGTTRFDALVRRVRLAADRPAAPAPSLLFTPAADGGRVDYLPEVVGPDLVESLVDGFHRVCAQVADDPAARLADLDVLGPALRHELVHTRNDTAQGYPFAGDCLHRLVEQMVDHCPHETAVVCGGVRLTYAELDAAANRLAHHLIDLGVGPEVPVGVLLDRSAELLVGLLGVLKAGGCYVPLEPSYPAARLAFMAQETAVPVLLTRSDLADRLPAGPWTVVGLDTDAERVGRLPAHRPRSTVTPDNLAYVIYTSGSTGRPKGVLVPHRGVVHYLAWCGRTYRAQDGTGAPVHSPPSFDLTVTGLFLPLMCGRTVTLVPEDAHPVVGLAEQLREGSDFTFVKLTPGHLTVLAQCLPDPAAARWLVVGGEQLTAEQLAFWREQAPHVMVANEYGHTETSVACVMECRPAGELTTSPVCVGRPFWNTQLYLVDEELNLVPPGVPGEVLTGGVGVTRGYWRRPALTAEKFIPNPFGEGRVYRSGDILRYLPDGRLEFVARIDRQVKVRGFRVEPGEIEARIAEYPGVRQAVVALRPDPKYAVPQLTAYVEAARPVSKKDLAPFVRDRLPEYMVPDRVITLDAFPLTPNGKTDHDELFRSGPDEPKKPVHRDGTDERRRARRRRVRLSVPRAVPVAFAGRRAVEGPLTLGQLNIVEWLSHSPDHPLATMWRELEVADGMSVDDVADTVAVLLGRHEALRTTYVVAGEHSRQHVAGAGTLMLQVCSLGHGHWGPDDRHTVADALGRWMYAREPLDTQRLPIRVAVATAPDRDGRAEQVVACVAELSHMAVDHHGADIVAREFAELVRDRSARRAGEPCHQPLNQVELEASPAGQRQAETALCYWQDQLERMPHFLYVPARATATGESLAVEMSSAAAAMAVHRVAARTRVSRSSIVLAAICAVLARRTGYRELVFPLISSNRFERHLARYVGTLAQGTVATVEVGAGGFDALVKHTWTSVMEASRHGRYHAFQRTELGGRIGHERGLSFTYEPVFNNLTVESRSDFDAGAGYRPEQVSAAVGRTELRWRPVRSSRTPVRFGLHQVDGLVRLDGWSIDNGLVSRVEIESMLLAVERLLVAAAYGDLDADRMGEQVGLEPIVRGPQWLLVDNCWVDLGEVQRLLDDTLSPAVARIFPSVDGQPLVACVAATGSVHTARQAHARCMAALPDRPGVLAPRRYVVCRAAPPDPGDLAAWQAVLDSGTGRAS